MERVKVWELPVRLFHGALPLLGLVLFLTSENEEHLPLHARAGLLVLALVVARIAWGFFGGRHARFSDFVPSPSGLIRYVRSYVRGKPEPHLGHNPLGALMVLALLALLLGATVTGVLLYAGPEWDGALGFLPKPLAEGLEETHEVFAHLLIPLVVLHVAGVLLSSWLEGQNLPMAMVTGYKRAEPSAPRAPRPSVLRLGVATALGVFAAMLAWSLLPASARADTPSDLSPQRAMLAHYEAEARKNDPAFAADAARGARFHRAESTASGKPAACATCHTADPRRPGKSPAGKNVEPLAPEVTPARFTDLSHVEKWFGRNCKQVLGRACTAEEKADYVAYALSPAVAP